MSWKKERDAWLSGRIQPRVRYADVENWLLSEPLFQPYLTEGSGGSHRYNLKVPGISAVLSGIQGNTLVIPVANGNACKKVYVEKLVQIYLHLLSQEKVEVDEDREE